MRRFLYKINIFFMVLQAKNHTAVTLKIENHHLPDGGFRIIMYRKFGIVLRYRIMGFCTLLKPGPFTYLIGSIEFLIGLGKVNNTFYKANKTHYPTENP